MFCDFVLLNYVKERKIVSMDEIFWLSPLVKVKLLYDIRTNPSDISPGKLPAIFL